MIPIVLSVIRIESSSIRSFGQMLDFRGCDFQDVPVQPAATLALASCLMGPQIRTSGSGLTERLVLSGRSVQRWAVVWSCWDACVSSRLGDSDKLQLLFLCERRWKRVFPPA